MKEQFFLKIIEKNKERWKEQRQLQCIAKSSLNHIICFVCNLTFWIQTNKQTSDRKKKELLELKEIHICIVNYKFQTYWITLQAVFLPFHVFERTLPHTYNLQFDPMYVCVYSVYTHISGIGMNREKRTKELRYCLRHYMHFFREIHSAEFFLVFYPTLSNFSPWFLLLYIPLGIFHAHFILLLQFYCYFLLLVLLLHLHHDHHDHHRLYSIFLWSNFFFVIALWIFMYFSYCHFFKFWFNDRLFIGFMFSFFYFLMQSFTSNNVWSFCFSICKK